MASQRSRLTTFKPRSESHTHPVIKRLGTLPFRSTYWAWSLSAALIGKLSAEPDAISLALKRTARFVLPPTRLLCRHRDRREPGVVCADLSQKTVMYSTTGRSKPLTIGTSAAIRSAVVLVLETSTRLRGMIPVIHGLGSILAKRLWF